VQGALKGGFDQTNRDGQEQLRDTGGGRGCSAACVMKRAGDTGPRWPGMGVWVGVWVGGDSGNEVRGVSQGGFPPKSADRANDSPNRDTN
jgi:hypothetical protein